jgi:hypothetical protein
MSRIKEAWMLFCCFMFICWLGLKAIPGFVWFLLRYAVCMVRGHKWGEHGSWYSGPFIKTGRYCERCDSFKREGPTVCR